MSDDTAVDIFFSKIGLQIAPTVTDEYVNFACGDGLPFLTQQKKLNLYLKDVEVEIQLIIRASPPKAAPTCKHTHTHHTHAHIERHLSLQRRLNKQNTDRSFLFWSLTD